MRRRKAPIAGPPAPRQARRMVDPRVAQFREPEARERVRAQLALHPDLEATAFTHRPWHRGRGLTGEEAMRATQGKSIRVAGIIYSITDRVVCDECTYERHTELKTEGWGRPIFTGGAGQFDCTVCGATFNGELQYWVEPADKR